MSLPGISRFQSFKDVPAMTTNPLKVFQKYMQGYGDTYSFYFGGLKKAIVTSNPTVLHHVLLKNNSNYQKSEIQVKRMGEFLGSGLLTSHGKYWLTQRRLIQQSFNKDQLLILSQIMHQTLKESIELFDKEIEKGPVDINEQMMKFTFRLATKSLFSTGLQEDELGLLSSSIAAIQKYIVKLIVTPYLKPWFRISGTQRRYEKMRKESDSIILNLITKRREGNCEFNDLLQNLLNAKYTEDGKGMTDKQILMESMQLLVAGHETSSNALSWIWYMLCKNPECLTKVKAELDNIIGNDDLQYNHLHQLEYTVQVIEESLRIYPPFWILDRVAMNNDIVDGVKIPAGSIIMLFLYGLHHSSAYWTEPEKFIPDRFTAENKKKHPPFIYLPFGGGPRVCIGGNYAMIQILLILVTMLRKYKFELVENQEIIVKPMIILKPENGIKIQFTK